jgi:hypothetical protein
MITTFLDNMDFAYKTCVILSALILPICIGQGTGDSVKFTMKISPEGDVQDFKIGTNRILACEASATADNQKPTLSWEVKGVVITAKGSERIRIENKNNALMLRVDNVKDGDEGTYRCVATLGSQTDSRLVRIQLILELSMKSDKENQFGIFGQDGEVKCEAVAIPPPVITWKLLDGTNIESNEKTIIMPDRLVIKNLQNSDTKTYVCDVVIIQTGITETFNIKFQVVHLPKIEMVPIISPNNPKEGDPEVKITCNAAGDPKPTYEFMKGDNLLPEQMYDRNNGILTITNLRREDEGYYTCVAKNIGGSDKKSNKLDVKIPPIILDIPDVKDAVEGGQQRVTCTAQGDPAPTLIWQRQGSPAYSDGIRDSGPEIINVDAKDRDDAEIKSVGKIMNFNPIRPQDVGTYICTAINIVGNATKSIKFEVKYKPTFDTDFKDTVFFGWKGHMANLTCLASANEVATIQWNEQRDNQTIRIENNDPYTVTTSQVWPEYYLTSSSLVVNVLDENSPVFKDYTCEAINTMGRTTHTVTLKRALPPGLPTVRVPTVMSTKVTLEVLAPENNGGLPVSGYHYSYYPETDQSGQVEKDVDSTLAITTVELKDLRANTPYVIRTSARNAAGIGSERVVSFQTKDVSSPLPINIISPNEGNEPTTYTVKWNDPDDGGSPITQYLIKHKAVTANTNNPLKWEVTGDIDLTFTEEVLAVPSARSFLIKGLTRDTYYDVRLICENKQGRSLETMKIIKTSRGAGADSNGNSAASLTVNVVITLLLILACLSAPW